MVLGCEKFVPALAYLFNVEQPGSCSARFAYFLADLCKEANIKGCQQTIYCTKRQQCFIAKFISPDSMHKSIHLPLLSERDWRQRPLAREKAMKVMRLQISQLVTSPVSNMTALIKIRDIYIFYFSAQPIKRQTWHRNLSLSEKSPTRDKQPSTSSRKGNI